MTTTSERRLAGATKIREAKLPTPEGAAADLDAIVDRALAGIDESLHDRLLDRARYERATEQLVSAFEQGRGHETAGMLNQFNADLVSAVVFERMHGSLRPYDAADEIKKWSGRLTERLCNGFETDTLRQMLQNEHIVAVDYRKVTTDQREITRDDIRRFAEGRRIQTLSPDPHWHARFTSEAIIQQAERLERERAIPKYESGPSSLIGKPIPQGE